MADFLIVRDSGELTRSTAVPDLVSGRKTEKVQIPKITLNDLLEKLQVEKIDFLNMDIELWEPQALAGFDIDKYRTRLLPYQTHPALESPSHKLSPRLRFQLNRRLGRSLALTGNLR